MNVNRHLEYIYQLKRFRPRTNLTHMQTLLGFLGNPHESLQSVHIGGTNGKGSTASFVATILQRAGYTVGLYTSPYIYIFNDRIQINGVSIPDDRLVALIVRIQEVIDREKLSVTFFEFITALAFLYFSEEKIDIAVIEVGVGGDLDPTNVLKKTLVSVITNVSYDHQHILGNTLEEIAGHKAGIIKPNGVVITADEQPSVVSVLNNACKTNNATLIKVQEVVSVKHSMQSWQGQEFTVAGSIQGTFKTKLLGAYQIINACTALTVIHVLRQQGFSISDAAVYEGLFMTYWPARLEVISQNPLILVDGSHNEAGFIQLSHFLHNPPMPAYAYEVLIVGVKRNKNPENLMRYIVPFFPHIIVTESNHKAIEADIFARQLQTTFPHKTITIARTPNEAFVLGKQKLSPNDCMLITGSLYLAGDILAHLRLKRG